MKPRASARRIAAKAAQLALRAALAALLAPLAGGCYYAGLARGQLDIVCAQVPIAEALAEHEGLRPDERELLAQVPAILAFARERVGLETGGSYASFYDTGDGPVSWNVTACAKTSFTPHLWWFPIIGWAPYKGFFDLEEAKEEARGLAEAGLDVRIGQVPAYSTLGWFDDPVFRSMLRYGRFSFVSTLLHEATHATIFRPGDAAFNESLATFVGEQAALEYLRERYGEGSGEVALALAERHDAALFAGFMRTLYLELKRLYDRTELARADKLEERERVFARARERFAQLRAERFRSGGYAGFARMELDNCLLMLYRTYHRDLAAFEQVHRLTGGRWARTLAVFREAAEAERPFAFLARWRYAAWRRRLAALKGAGTP